MLDYIEQRAALRSNSKPSPAAPATLFGAPAMTSTAKCGSSVNPSAPTGLFGGVGSTSASLDKSQAATATPEAAGASSTLAGSSVETSVRGGEDADVRWKGMVKVRSHTQWLFGSNGEFYLDAMGTLFYVLRALLELSGAQLDLALYDSAWLAVVRLPCGEEE